jgi:hypothetical protein
MEISMKDTYLSIRIESALKDQVVTLAKMERRSIADQAAYLVEQGLLALKGKIPEGTAWGDRLPTEAWAGTGAALGAGTGAAKRAGKTA